MEPASFAARVGPVTAEALALREGRSPASARALLAACARRGELRRHRPLAGRPLLYTPPGVAVGGVAPASAEHAIACARVAALLELAYPGRVALGEHLLRAAPRPWARPRAGACGHRPDLLLVGPGAPLAVEVELSVKAPARLLALCRAWALTREVQAVLYVAAPAVRPALVRALGRAGSPARIAVLALEDLSGPCAAAAFARAIPSGP